MDSFMDLSSPYELVYTLFVFSCFNAQPHIYGHALVHQLIIGEILTVLGFFQTIRYAILMNWKNIGRL